MLVTISDEFWRKIEEAETRSDGKEVAEIIHSHYEPTAPVEMGARHYGGRRSYDRWRTPKRFMEVGKNRLDILDALLYCLDPDCCYLDWIRIGMAIFYETGGSDEGLTIFDDWSSDGMKYRGIGETRKKWRSFRLDVPHPVTIGSLIRMACSWRTETPSFRVVGDIK
jgi:hypothetical protein